MNNLLLETDSYKFGGHWEMLFDDTESVYSYFESRSGAEYTFTKFFGLQYILKKYFVGNVVTREMIDEAEMLSLNHLGSKESFNKEGWEYILNKYDGKIPLVIKAVKEGSEIPNSQVLMTVECEDDKLAWLTNYVESILTHVWYPSVVCTKSKHTINIIEKYLNLSCDYDDATRKNILSFMLHDFGYRATECPEASAIGGAAHLINSLGTDTIPAIKLLRDYYNGNNDFSGIGYSVPASEHSIATQKGEKGEIEYLDRMLEKYPSGIVSIVADSYNIERFVDKYIRSRKDEILKRANLNNGKINRIVIRPDSKRFKNDTPYLQVLWIFDKLWDIFGGTVNSKGKKVLNSCVGVIYGDGLSTKEIKDLYHNISKVYSVESLVVGQGGGLLQKVNRDTQRSSFKCSAQKQNGEWVDIQKKPLDISKKSKAGKLKLIKVNDEYKTVRLDDPKYKDYDDELVTIFSHGKLLVDWTLDQVRNAS